MKLAILLTLMGAMNAQVRNTEHVPFQAGGTVRVENSYGYLTVEGWDEPEVQVTVTKSTNHDGVHIALESTAPGEAAIRTNAPPARLLILRWPSRIRAGVMPDYSILIPRDARLFVQHDHGYVWINDVRGDLEVHSHTGDMIVALSEASPYAIDARVKFGSVWSDFDEGKRIGHFLLGSGFIQTPGSPAPRVRLRMGRGNITIVKGPTSGPYWKN